MKELEKRAVSMAKKSDSEVAEIAKNKMIRVLADKQVRCCCFYNLSSLFVACLSVKLSVQVQTDVKK